MKRTFCCFLPLFFIFQFSDSKTFAAEKKTRSRISAPRGDFKNSPEMAQKFFQKAKTLREKGKLGEAMDFVKRALVADPDFGEGWLELADLHTVFGASDRALEDLNEGIPLAEKQGIDPTVLARSYGHRARINVAERRPDLASGDLLKILTLLPNDPTPHKILAEIHAERGHTESAIESYKRALKLDSKNVECWQALGEQALKAGKNDLAGQVYIGLYHSDSWKAKEFAQKLIAAKIKVPDPSKVQLATAKPKTDDPYAMEDDPYAAPGATSKNPKSEQTTPAKAPNIPQTPTPSAKPGANIVSPQLAVSTNTVKPTGNTAAVASSTQPIKPVFANKAPNPRKPPVNLVATHIISSDSKVPEIASTSKKAEPVASGNVVLARPQPTPEQSVQPSLQPSGQPSGQNEGEEVSKEAEDALKQLSEESDDLKRSLAKASLAAMGDKVIPQLKSGLKNPNPRYRTDVLDILAGMGEDGKKIIPEIKEISANDPDPEVKQKADRILMILQSQHSGSGDFQ
ncbi:MAG: tetratricopeptide repeat protein [Candidatus Riflebacteria bacterium]|nr:tetratricopeptide repeat protein [Candidatus Riflebacteria bacterium]